MSSRKDNQKTLRIMSLEIKVTPLYDVLIQNVIDCGSKYVEANMQAAMIFRNRVQLWNHATKKVRKSALWLEFGVHSGCSINAISNMNQETVHGFDSFEGL
jgi:hypothetical protein